MPVTTRLFDISLAPGLEASVTITTPNGSKARAEQALCYYRFEDQTAAICNVSVAIDLAPTGVPEPPVGPPVAAPALIGALALAAFGAARFQRS